MIICCVRSGPGSPFRDAQCDSEADTAAGGRDPFVIDQQCAERLTRERIRQPMEMTEWQN
jgi:uncharacterized protein YecT (DUF1311 family)